MDRFFEQSTPYLKEAVNWQYLGVVTFSFHTQAKVVKQDNLVLVSKGSLQHCSIMFNRQTQVIVFTEGRVVK